MTMYNLIQHSDNYSKTSGCLWKYYRGESFLDNNGTIADVPVDSNNDASFKFKTKIAGRTGNDGIKMLKLG